MLFIKIDESTGVIAGDAQVSDIFGRFTHRRNARDQALYSHKKADMHIKRWNEESMTYAIKVR